MWFKLMIEEEGVHPLEGGAFRLKYRRDRRHGLPLESPFVFYPRYFDIFDASTSALFERVLGISKLELLKTFNFAGFPLVHTRARFLRPTRYGDDVVIDTTINFGRSSFEIQHKISHNGEACVECSEMRVWVVRDPATGGLKSHPLPEAVLKKFGSVLR